MGQDEGGTFAGASVPCSVNVPADASGYNPSMIRLLRRAVALLAVGLLGAAVPGAAQVLGRGALASAPAAPVALAELPALAPAAALGASPTSVAMSVALAAPAVAPSAAAPASPAAGGAAAPAPDAVAPRPDFALLRGLGLYDRIVRRGGLRARADGTIAPVRRPLVLRAFDNDDNLVFYSTKLYLRHKTTGEEKALTTAEFAAARTDIGRAGAYRDYELFGLQDADGGSFRDFLDANNPKIFSQDMAAALARADAAWRGPSWTPFAEGLSDARDAAWVAIITSRAHRPRSLADGFRVLKRRGELKRVPRPELIFPVGEQSDVQRALPGWMKTPERKAEVLMELLDLLESVPLADPAARHVLSFSDDDPDQIERVRARLAADQAAGRWPRVRIVLFSTAPRGAWRAEL